METAQHKMGLNLYKRNEPQNLLDQRPSRIAYPHLCPSGGLVLHVQKKWQTIDHSTTLSGSYKVIVFDL